MWWKSNPQRGERRTVTRFLWFPTEAYNPRLEQYETRWLTKETFTQEYRQDWESSLSRWEAILWVD